MNNLMSIYHQAINSMNIGNDMSDNVRQFMVNKLKLRHMYKMNASTDHELSNCLDAIVYQLDTFYNVKIDTKIIDQFNDIMKQQMELANLLISSLK